MIRQQVLLTEQMRTYAGFASLLIAWELLARFAFGQLYILSPPTAIVMRIIEDLPLYTRALGATVSEALLGFVLGNLAAIVLAVLVVTIPPIERLAQAIALVVFCLPLVATGPILRVIYGPGWGPQITLAALSVYYTTFVPLVVGLRAVPPSWLDLIASYGRGRLTAMTVVRARACLPYLIASLKIAAPAAFLGAIVGEFTGADRGIGVLSIQAMRSLDVDGTWALATIASAVAIIGYALVGWAGQLLSIGAPPSLLVSPASKAPKVLWKKLFMAVAAPILSCVVILLLWQVFMDGLELSRFFAKRPGDVWAYLVAGSQAAAHRSELFAALRETMGTTVLGYLAGLGLGAVLAAVFCMLPAVEKIASPVAIALRSIPIVATAPLLVLVLGRGQLGMLGIVAIMIFFPTLVSCLHGLRQTPGQVIDYFDSYQAPPLTQLFLARVPAMLPSLFAAARMAVPMAVLAATVAEWLATGTGIGNLMALTSSTSNYNMLWSCVTILTLVSVAGYALVAMLERRVLSHFAPEQVI
ncbi:MULTISPECIES: ABC transporter permease [Pacificibacter]|uniref:ABC transporter permease n=1 Tax=Pacificibacter TaxID=1042323 RepID=UPI00209188EA|nr:MULTISPECIES: ABC transporter permease subunit [Pacificibacter]MDO6616616.1 ABC transporter permease subunit [Pacificibacter sp. 1_MG-2023]